MNESSNPIQPLTKIVVARAQMVMALDLFVRDKDPISIQCLACGGGEVVEGLAEAHGEEPFAMHILKTQPDMDRKAIRMRLSTSLTGRTSRVRTRNCSLNLATSTTTLRCSSAGGTT